MTWTVHDDSEDRREPVDGSGGQIGVDENRYEQKKDREEKRDRERAGCKTIMLSEAKHLYIRIEMRLCGVKDPSLALRMTVDGLG